MANITRLRKIDGDIIFSVALIIVTLLLLSISTTTVKVDENLLGPFFWPKVMLSGLMICAALKLILHLYKSARSFTIEGAVVKPDRMTAVLSVLFVSGYFFSIGILGYPLASVIFIPLFAYLGGVRRFKTILITGIGVTLATSILFVGLMYVSLPRGEWIFNDVTNFLFSLMGK